MVTGNVADLPRRERVVPRGEAFGVDSQGAGQPRFTERGAKSFELASLFGRVYSYGHGGRLVEAEIPRQELDYYASRLLSVGTEVVVESPPELSEAIRKKAREVARLYG
jgi:predicted DNA-binding transcriptional regulator YafY